MSPDVSTCVINNYNKLYVIQHTSLLHVSMNKTVIIPTMQTVRP